MKTQRIFDITNAKARRFKEFCRDMHINAVIERHDTYKRFYCFMSDTELSKAKVFCDMWCRPEKPEKVERKEECRPKVVYIIIEETRILYV